jgi:hypothetical protein
MSTDWVVSTYEEISASPEWVIDTSSLKRPNANVSLECASIYSTDVLINGDKAVTIPEIKGHYSPVQFLFLDDDLTIYNQFLTYQQNAKYLKIETHNPSITFYGRVQSVVAEWIAGQEHPNGGDSFDVLVVIDRTNTLS